jgi:endonuclease/exonuclease/phosphatase family metal-dependent hydrolase
VRVVRVATWNVLHRVHAANWSEALIAAFPEEAVRIARISERVASWLGAGVDAVCLQEVSGDQLASLRRVLGDGFQVFAHLYPRLPKLRGRGGPVLDDATEHLVMLVCSPDARRVGARTFAADPGKGMLIAELGDGIRVIDTHVSFGPRKEEQLTWLVEGALEAPRGAIVLGDFNAPADEVQAALGTQFTLCDLRSQRATRVSASDPPRTIDHIAVHRGAIEGATVLDDEALSDHAPVTASVRFA